MKTPAVSPAVKKIRTYLAAKDQLNDTIIRLRLYLPEEGYDYYAGQCLTLYNNEGVGRMYCLSSVPGLDDFLELQISLTSHGALIPWIYGELQVGDQVRISPASGDCFYLPGDLSQPIMLIGTGIALAPLYGILRDALIKHGHKGDIRLFHQTHSPDEYYLIPELMALQTEYPNFSYTHFIHGKSPVNVALDVPEKSTSEMAFGTIEDLSFWQLFLCGDPSVIKEVKQDAILLGAKENNIFETPFAMPGD
ncbi:oxygenase [Methylobacter sp.]|uniref:oxygenase n=1 Tax=Methylobacter sp. TaxID=2051955 RepID=UPI003DA3254C